MSGSKKNKEQEVDVLYQKLGENWFAFSIIEDEVFMSPVSDDQIKEIKKESVSADIPNFPEWNHEANKA